MLAILRKELADYFNSIRFLVLFLLVLVASAFGLYAVQQGIRATLEASKAVTDSGFVFLALFTSSYQNIPSLTFSIGLIIPIVGIALGFDAINSERSGGTMSRILSQPVYRDSVINGKFLAGIITMTIMVSTTLLLVAGYGLRMIGVPPTAYEIIRLFIYLVITVIYGAFWMGLAMLFSVVFRKAAGSLLIPLAIFLVLYFFWVMLGLGPAIANSMVPVGSESTLATQIKNAELQLTLLRISPSYLFEEAYILLLAPVWKGMGVITVAQANYMIPNPLSLGQSLLVIWPHIVGLISLSAICFGISYIVFMKQEIRAT
jgi:ABC-2 type transport system permease protein